VYPLLIALCGCKAHLIAAIQVFLAASTISIFYLLARQLIENRWLAFLAVAVLIGNFGVISYQGAILTETLAACLVALAVWGHIRCSIRRSASSLAWLFFCDSLLVLTRPALALLPAAWCVVQAVWEAWNGIRRRAIRIPWAWIVGLGMNIAVVGGYGFMNYLRYDCFSLTSVGGVNMLGKMIQYAYVTESLPSSAPPDVRLFVRIYHQTGHRTNPWIQFAELQKAGRGQPEHLAVINNYFLRGHRLDFVANSVVLAGAVATMPPAFYVPYRPSLNPVAFWRLFGVYRRLAKLYLLGIAAGSLIAARLWLKDDGRTVGWALLVATACYALVAISMFSPGEYERLRAPVELILGILVTLPMCLGLEGLGAWVVARGVKPSAVSRPTSMMGLHE
jgi:hypothetical protein